MIGKYLGCGLLWMSLCSDAGFAAEYFVSLEGSDNHGGQSRVAAFATIQKGLDALDPGDTLTILPGEYFGSARRQDLGSDDAVTTIRADIPGTVTLRGDIPAPKFREMEADGIYAIHVAELDPAVIVRTVNELDTLMVLPGTASLADLRFTPGLFFQDVVAGRLYLTTVDNRPAGEHAYSLSVAPGNGLDLSSARREIGPRRVVVEGLAATGFNAAKHGDDGTGIALGNARGCVVRDCRAWLNGWGIRVSAEAEGAGSNVIERCTAWANDSMFANSRIGGISGIGHRGDIIRDSTAFLNANCGIYLRIDADPTLTSRMQRNLAWGNRWDLIIKGNPGFINVTEQSVGEQGPGHREEFKRDHPDHCLYMQAERPHGEEGAASDTIILSEETDLDLHREFADPENHDYRLQATSRFRGTAPDGTDRGPFPYQANIFYVKTNGNDRADGFSVSNAWRTIARAVQDLKPGDTLYLCGGRYAAASLEVGPAAPGGRSTLPGTVTIRGRGRAVSVIEGPLTLSTDSAIAFERIEFAGPVACSAPCPSPSFRNCWFTGPGTSLTAQRVAGLDVRHCGFKGFDQAAIVLEQCSGAHLSGNLYDNRDGVPALRMENSGAIRYADYNAFRDPACAWEIAEARTALANAPDGRERYSVALPERCVVRTQPTRLTDRSTFMSAGPLGWPFGPVWVAPRQQILSLARAPYVHALSTRTADIEWGNVLPTRVRLAWGATPELENRDVIEVDYYGSYSLTGLEPGKTYYFRIESLEESRKPLDMHSAWRPGTMQTTGGPLEGGLVTFTTLASDPAPATVWVAPDGDDSANGLSRATAWRTIQHAADRVRAGDTVLIAGGTYEEQVRVRASGAPGAPLTFRSAPGAQVILSAGEREQDLAFDVTAKHHLRFDGMYLLAKCFQLQASSHLEITRMFAGRYSSNYAPALLYATGCSALTVKNCVSLSAKYGPSLRDCRDYVRIENCVFFRNMITQLDVGAARRQAVQGMVARNIFTDGLSDKFFAYMLGISAGNRPMSDSNNHCVFNPLDFSDNCFYPRRDWEQKRLVNRWTFAELDDHFGETRSLLANPEFAGLAGVPEKTADGHTIYPPDRMCGTGAISLDKFFATNPELVKRGIGLQPEAFKDFHCMSSDQPSAQP